MSFILALVFAPSVFGFDLGAFTVPAVVMLLVGLTGGLRGFGIIFAIISIFSFWVAIFGGWSLFAFLHGRTDKYIS